MSRIRRTDAIHPSFKPGRQEWVQKDVDLSISLGRAKNLQSLCKVDREPVRRSGDLDGVYLAVQGLAPKLLVTS
jgi:hypothetical protein